MGALDKRIFSGVAMLSALLFVVSAILLLADGGDVNADSNDTALYILTVSGILAVVYSVVLMMDRSSFVRTLSGAVVAIAGIIYLAVPFAGGADTMIAVASIVAAVAMIADMLALWVSRVYGAMYVTAVLAALELITGVLHFINDPQASYYAIALLVFGVWLCLSAYVTGFVKTENATRTREVKEDKVAKKAERPQAKNTKATKKAKKPEKKEEPKPEPKPEVKEAPKEEPKETPKEEPKPEPKPAQQHEGSEERPKIKPVRTVELPKRNADVKPESKPEPKPEVKEAPKEEPKETPKEEPKAAQPAKSSNDFMKKLMTSQNANRAKQVRPVEVPKEEPKEEPKPVEEATEAPAPKEEAVPEVPVQPAAEEVETPDQPEEPNAVEAPEEQPMEDAPVQSDEAIEEPEPEEVPVEEPEIVEPEQAVTEEVIEEEAPTEEPEVADEQPMDDEEAYGAIEYIPEDEQPAQPEDVPEEQPEEVPVEEPEAIEEPAPIEEPVAIEEQPTVTEEPEVVEAEPTVTEEAPAEESEPEEAVVEASERPEADATPEVVPAAEPEAVTAVPAEESEEEFGEDLYTDYSPEAVVRRAAWNKGLRCRRNYGPHNIPVAFVKGKVAVFVDEPGADTSVDAELEAEGWTVIRYDATTVTDGKAQGEEIAAAVKANLRSSKSSKRKSKK